MPKIIPSGGEVDWPVNEGTLGVVGVAPWATIEFCKIFYSYVAAKKDWHYPRVLLDINTKLPSRGRYLQLGEKDPSPDIALTIEELANQGATLAVVVCNTAHILYDKWAKASPIPVLNIIEETMREVKDLKPSKISVLVSASLAAHGVYDKQAKDNGISCYSLNNDEQELVSATIEAVKINGRISPDVRVNKFLKKLILEGVSLVIGGCTELSQLRPLCEELGLVFVDSNDVLARSALRELHMSLEVLKV